ncbi:unnamed protein product, partial [Musa textilis]
HRPAPESPSGGTAQYRQHRETKTIQIWAPNLNPLEAYKYPSHSWLKGGLE